MPLAYISGGRASFPLFVVRRLLAFAFALFALTLGHAAFAGPETSGEAVASTRARLRVGAGPEYRTLATLPAGARLQILSDGKEFVQVRYEGQTGWVAKSLLTLPAAQAGATEASAPSTPAAPTAGAASTAASSPESTTNTPVASAPGSSGEAQAASLPPPPPTIVVGSQTDNGDSSSADTSATPWLLLLLIAAAAAIAGFLVGYQWRERYYRKRLYGLRL